MKGKQRIVGELLAPRHTDPLRGCPGASSLRSGGEAGEGRVGEAENLFGGGVELDSL